MISLEELSKLDEAGAMELLLAYTTDIKRHDKDIEALERDRQLWDSRVKLAEGKGLAELAQGARTQLSHIEASLSGITAARDELKLDVSRIREALPAIKARRRSIDPDLLQAELSMLAGGEEGSSAAKLEDEFKALEGAAESVDPLEKLKRKMGLGGSSDSKQGNTRS
jgi:capsule polysaccharide export protein KpsE/RkpR